MESNSQRIIFTGNEYDSLFPRPLLKRTTILEDASVEDTVAFMQQTIPKVKGETAKIAALLEASTLKATCRNIWNFVYHHIPYNPDAKGIEQVRSPAMVWWSRNHRGANGKVGVDCDCYTSFISATLCVLGIEHQLRITQYPKSPPEVPHWQHIYIVVPINQERETKLKKRSEYIVLDCVKDQFDDEQPFLRHRDYPMKLEYLSGLEGINTYKVPSNVDAQDLAAADEFDEMARLSGWEQETLDLGSLEGPKLKNAIKKVGKKIGQGVRLLNRVVNPATIALRNAFLLAMKVNFMKVASKLRYSYLSDTQAQQQGMNMEKFAKLKKIRQKAEDIYYKAGGKRENFAKAILHGKGNRDGKVPLQSLSGLSGLKEQEYWDETEYSILHGDYEQEQSLNGLGELVSAATLAAAVPAISAVAMALKEVKGLFPKSSPQGQEFDSEGSSQAVQAQGEDVTVAPTSAPAVESTEKNPPYVENRSSEIPSPASDVLPANRGQEIPATPSAPVSANPNTGGGFFEWIKENPMKATGIGLGVLGVGVLGYFLLKKKSSPSRSNSLEGLPTRSYRKKIGLKKFHRSSRESLTHPRIQTINLL